MNSLQNLIQRLSAIGQVTEAEEKCSKCGKVHKGECDAKDKVDEAAKPDADTKLPSMAHIKEMCEDGKTVAEICKMHPDCDQTKLKEMIADCKNKLDEGSKPDFLDIDNDGNKKEKMKDAVDDNEDGDDKVKEGAMDSLKAMGKKALDTLGHGDDEDLIKDMQKKAGLPQTGKKPGQEEEVKETALNLLRRYAGIQEAAPVNFDKVLNAIAALYGDDMWNNDSMQDLAHDLEQQNPTDQELDSIIATGELPQRLANTQFTNNDSVKFGEALNTSKLADTMGVDVQQLRMAVSRASTGKQTRSDIMLLSDTFVKLLNNPDDTVIQTVANLIKSGNTAPAPEANMKQEGNEFSGALKAAKDAGEEEFEVGGKKYKVNECSDMSPMSSVPNGESHMGIPAEIMARMSSPEMSEPEGPHMEVPMAAEEPNATYTLSIQNGENNLQMTTDVPDEIIHIMKLAGVNKGAEVTKKEMPAGGEQEVEESGYENTPDNTRARDPQAHGDIRDWGQKGTANASTHYTPAQSGDNPMNEQRMFQDYKNFKAGK